MNLLNSIKNNIPNAITSLNLLSGAMACIFALQSNEMFGGFWGYQISFLFIAMAAVFDFCDGFAARLLHAVSAIGKELDSLSDAVSFGLAPALLVYAMIGHFCPDGLWSYGALIIAVFGALRLARFNVDTTQSTSFVGLPIPANAIFWIGYCSAVYANDEMSLWVTMAAVVILSLLMVCNLRMFSLKFKNLSLKDNWHRYVLILASIFFLIVYKIEGLELIICFYFLESLICKFLIKDKN